LFRLRKTAMRRLFFALLAVLWLLRMQKYARNANKSLKINHKPMYMALLFRFWASRMMLGYFMINHFVVVRVFVAVAVLAAPFFAV